MTVYTIETDLDPEALTELAVETYQKWVSFALGVEEIGGKRIMHPTGRYASALSWKQNGKYSASIIADSDVTLDVDSIEGGTPAHSMKQAMLYSGNVNKSAGGFHYRTVPIKPSVSGRPTKSALTRFWMNLNKSKKGYSMSRAGLKSYNAPKDTSAVADGSVFRTMSDKPGSSDWVVPAMPAYSPAKTLAGLLEKAATRYA